MRTPSSPSTMRPFDMCQHAHRTDEQQREGNADDENREAERQGDAGDRSR